MTVHPVPTPPQSPRYGSRRRLRARLPARAPILLLQPLLLLCALLAPLVVAAAPPRTVAADAGAVPPGGAAASPRETAESLADEAVRYWDDKEYEKAIAKYRESIAAESRGETYRSLGWLYAELDRHAEAVAAFREAIRLDPSLSPELRLELGEQLLWADRPKEAVPLLESVHAARPADTTATRRLALAYRWTDRYADADALYRSLLAADPADADARAGLGWSLLWRDRYRESGAAFAQALEKNPKEPDALVGLSRARLFLDLPDEADEYNRRVLAADPRNADALAQERRIRERTRRHIGGEAWAAHDSDDLTILRLELSAYARAARGLDLRAAARHETYRQGSPGKTANIGDADRADGTAGLLDADWRPTAALAFRGGFGLAHYNVSNFHPWSGHAGATWEPRDLWSASLDWERSSFDTIHSFQDGVVADTVSASLMKSFEGKVEVKGSAAWIAHHNDNRTGQSRENRGWRGTLEATVPLLRKGDATHLAALAKLEWLAFDETLDVGVFNPERYTTEEAGLDGRWAATPRWELFATALGGAQQEIGNAGGLTYSVDAGVDRRIGDGVVTLSGFATDSRTAGPGGGFRRQGGSLRFRIPF